MRILIAEDDKAIAAGLEASLRQSGHAVDIVEDGAKAQAALGSATCDLLILDLGLPHVDGVDVLRHLRQHGKYMPILIITARSAVGERVRVLDLGADDYLVKPFALTEFEARVRALLRRYNTHGAAKMTFGRLSIDLVGRRAWVDDDPLELTAREFGLLEVLATHSDRITSRTQIIESLCNWDQDLSDNGLDISIYRLRRKLTQSGVQVRTIRGLGYLLEETDDS